MSTDLRALGIERIRQHDLHSEITSRLAKLIAKSSPGSRLPSERELCELLDVGRNSIREAVRSLAFIGALQVRQGDGIYVAKIEDADVGRLVSLGLMMQRSGIHEVIEARRLIEVDVVTLAAERHTEEDRALLLRNINELVKHIHSASEASRLDLEFHALLARARHNSVFVFFVNGMRTLIKAWIDIKIDMAADRRQVMGEILEDHQAILDAVLKRDADVAAALMSEHLRQAGERLTSAIEADPSISEDIFALLMAKSRAT